MQNSVTKVRVENGDVPTDIEFRIIEPIRPYRSERNSPTRLRGNPLSGFNLSNTTLNDPPPYPGGPQEIYTWNIIREPTCVSLPSYAQSLRSPDEICRNTETIVNTPALSSPSHLTITRANLQHQEVYIINEDEGRLIQFLRKHPVSLTVCYFWILLLFVISCIYVLHQRMNNLI